MSLQNEKISDFEKFLEANPSLKDYKVHITEPGVAVLSKENILENKPVESVSPTILDVIQGPSNKIKIKKSPVHNYGIFAIEDIEEGELIEEIRLLRLGWRAKYNGDPVIKDYVWTNNNCKCKECLVHGPNQYLALGYGSIYNHSDDQNTVINMDYKNEIMTIKAKQLIPKDTEIFVNYGKNYWKVRQKKELANETKEETKNSESGTKE